MTTNTEAERTAPRPISGACAKVRNVYAWRRRDGQFEVHKFYAPSRGGSRTAPKPSRWVHVPDWESSRDLTEDERMELRNELRSIEDAWGGLSLGRP